MATNHTAKNDSAPSTPGAPTARLAKERAEPHAKINQAPRAKPPAQQSRKAAQQANRRP